MFKKNNNNNHIINANEISEIIDWVIPTAFKNSLWKYSIKI